MIRIIIILFLRWKKSNMHFSWWDDLVERETVMMQDKSIICGTMSLGWQEDAIQCTSGGLKLWHLITTIIEKATEFQKNIYICCIDYAKAFDCVDHNKPWKILKEMGIPDHLTCLLGNLYAGQEVTLQAGHGTTDCFPNRKRSISRLYIVTLLI